MGQLFVVNDCATKEDLISYLSHMQSLGANKRRKTSCNTNKSYKKAKMCAVSDKTPVTKITNFSSCELSSLSSLTSAISPQQRSSVMADFKCISGMVGKSQCSHGSGADSMVKNVRDCYTVNKTVRKRKRVVVTEGEDKVENHLVRKSRKPCDILKEKLKRSMSAEKRLKSELIIPKKDDCNNYNKISSVCIGKKSPTFSDTTSVTCPDETFTLHENIDLCYQQNLGHNKHIDSEEQPIVYKAVNVDVSEAPAKLKIRKNHVRKSTKGKQKAIKDIALSSKCDTKVFSDGYFSDRNDQEIDISFKSCGNGIFKSKDLDWTRASRIDESLCLARVFDGESPILNDPEDNVETKSASNQELSDTDVQLSSIQNIPNQMYVAVDCEMVGVGPKGKQSVLARCSIVDYDGNVIYDKYIRPSETITDYRTPWSGIRPTHMKTAVPIHLALQDIKECLKNKVVIGHAVYHDFKVIGMTPDHIFVRDTAQCHRLVEMAQLQGRGNSLKKLSQALLDRKIQESRHGHCSVEDARATLDLFKLVRQLWEPELYLKWSKKDANISQKIAQFVNCSSSSSYHQDFLDDKFWPSDVLD